MNVNAAAGRPVAAPAVHQSRQSRLVPVLLIVTGLVDATTDLGLGHVFAANITGNVVLIGFALAGAGGISATASIISLAAFLIGSLSAGIFLRNREANSRQVGAAFILERLGLGLAAGGAMQAFSALRSLRSLHWLWVSATPWCAVWVSPI